MTRFVLRAFDIHRDRPDAGPLADANTLAVAAARWRDTPFGRDVAFAGTGKRLQPLTDAPAAATLVAETFPAQVYLSDKPRFDAADAAILWTIGLRRTMVTAFVEWSTDAAGLNNAVAALPGINARVRACIPDAIDGPAYRSCVELPGGLSDRSMPLPATGRLTATALADLIDPRYAIHAFEHRLEDALTAGDLPEGATMTDVDGLRLIRWYADGEDWHAALVRRLDWLARFADPA